MISGGGDFDRSDFFVYALRMIRPYELRTGLMVGGGRWSADSVWEVFWAAHAGDLETLRRVAKAEPDLLQAEALGATPVLIATAFEREEVLRFFWQSGVAMPTSGPDGRPFTTWLEERGLAPPSDSPPRDVREPVTFGATLSPAGEAAFAAAASGDSESEISALAVDPPLITAFHAFGSALLHRAVEGGSQELAAALLDRGAVIDVRHRSGRPHPTRGYPPVGMEPIDRALWRHLHGAFHGDLGMAGLLLKRGAGCDLVVAAAMGDRAECERLVAAHPSSVHSRRASGKGVLSASVEAGHPELLAFFLALGADPNQPEGVDAPRGAALHAAARIGDLASVQRLLARGAGPNSEINSAGSATYAAKTPEIRRLLLAAGGRLSPYDLVWLSEDDLAFAAIEADPERAREGCGCVYTAICTLRREPLLRRLLDAGHRVPPVVNGCRSYLFEDPSLLRLLLESGMDPDLPNWLGSTALQDLCSRDARGRARENRHASARLLIEAGASLHRQDDLYRSTPLGHAARNHLPDMVDLLLALGAPAHEPNTPSFATPLAWARRFGHDSIAATLIKAMG